MSTEGQEEPPIHIDFAPTDEYIAEVGEEVAFAEEQNFARPTATRDMQMPVASYEAEPKPEVKTDYTRFYLSSVLTGFLLGALLIYFFKPQ